jgi:hypothetical protein
MIGSDIVQDVIRKPGKPRTQELEHSMTSRLMRIADKVRCFPTTATTSPPVTTLATSSAPSVMWREYFGGLHGSHIAMSKCQVWMQDFS